MMSDPELLEAWRGGDRNAGGRLFERHFDSICRFFANKVDRDVDDLVQRTFAACVEGQQRFLGHSSFRTYLFGVAHNILRAHLRSKGREQGRLDFGLSSVCDLGLNPAVLFVAGREQTLLLQGLRQIPLDHQLILELYYWEDLQGPELAEIFGVPEGTIRSRLRRARTLLEEQLARLAQSDALLHSTLTGLDDWARSLGDQLARSGKPTKPSR